MKYYEITGNYEKYSGEDLGQKEEHLSFTEAYSGPCQTSKMKVFADLVNVFQLLTI